MSGPLFLTGAGGFIGRSVVPALAASDVRVLARDVARLPPLPSHWSVVPGDLCQPDDWAAALAGVDTVLHLAALTGKARQAEHHAVNALGTARLVEVARAAGVRRVLFLSSIAAGYPDRRHYHYANAKLEAEAAVLGSGLEAIVLRPTMVLAPGSPVLANLSRLALLPRPVVLGSGVLLQPIHVEDVAAAVVAALALDRWGQLMHELGGPEEIELADLFARIRRDAGRPARRPFHVPLAPLRTVLAVLEPVALRLLPFSAGQLAAFANQSVARHTPLSRDLPRPTRSVDDMLGFRVTPP